MLRFLGIAFLKSTAFIILTFLLLGYILPDSFQGWWLAATITFLDLILSFLFAEWAYALIVPQWKDIGKLLIAWLGIFFFFSLIYVVRISTQGVGILLTLEYLLLLAVQILAVVVIGARLKKHRLVELHEEDPRSVEENQESQPSL